MTESKTIIIAKKILNSLCRPAVPQHWKQSVRKISIVTRCREWKRDKTETVASTVGHRFQQELVSSIQASVDTQLHFPYIAGNLAIGGWLG